MIFFSPVIRLLRKALHVPVPTSKIDYKAEWEHFLPTDDRWKTYEPDLIVMEAWINKMTKVAHKGNKHWWTDLDTGEPLARNVGEMLMLVVTELAEPMEGHRKNLMDDKLPEYKMFDVELADAIIRLLDIAEGQGVNLGLMVHKKMEFNKTRPDHQPEARRMPNGKKC